MPIPTEAFEKILVEREEEWKRDYPTMFSHPERREGEIFIGLYMCDAAGAAVMAHHGAGLTTSRLAEVVEYPTPTSFAHYPIFANFRQYVTLDEKHKLSQKCLA